MFVVHKLSFSMPIMQFTYLLNMRYQLHCKWIRRMCYMHRLSCIMLDMYRNLMYLMWCVICCYRNFMYCMRDLSSRMYWM